jgi:thiaminase/transcriptional activator TenA
MELHRSYCLRFGIPREALEATAAAPATLAYTSFLLRVAYQGSYAELVAALLPCQWGYWEIGAHLARQGEPASKPLYAEWIRMYSSPEFAALARQIREMADRLGDRAGPDQQAAMTAAYLSSFQLEYQFWEMAYNLEGWPV